MSDESPEAAAGGEAVDRAAERERVAATLDRLRAGVRQRQAELATVAAEREDTRLALVELRSLELAEEPLAVSPRPLVGRFLVLARKAFFHLGFKWWARPVLQQHNAFHRAAARLIEDVVGRLEAESRARAALARRVEELERRLDAGDAAPPAGG